MAGEAKTDAFMLGTATVMVGPQQDLFDLNPSDHSIGLVKNFQISSDPQYTDLTQGVKNTRVMSVMTQNQVTASMEVYEYTARNITYGLGLDGDGVMPVSDETTTSQEVDGSTSGVTQIDVNDASVFSAGDFVIITPNEEDHAYVRKVSSVDSTGDTITVDMQINVLLPSNTKIKKVNKIGVGSKADQPFFSAKVVGKLANNEQMTLLIPKIRVTNGFNLNFSDSDYGNLPFEFNIYDLVTTDPNYSWFQGDQARIFR
jgi:hypothetical protein